LRGVIGEVQVSVTWVVRLGEGRSQGMCKWMEECHEVVRNYR